MLWLLFDGWIRFAAPESFAFSHNKDGAIDLYVAKSCIGKVTYKKGGDSQPGDLGFNKEIEAIQMIEWLAIKLADERGFEFEA